jgi:transcriptional regulator with GAF, ATPase, and Fis domain
MNSSQPTRERQLNDVFVALADSLVTDYDVVELMQQLTGACVDLLHCAAAGLLLADQRGHLRVLASSSEQLRMLELFELQNAEGPCLDCYHTGSTVSYALDDASVERWPLFAPAAREAGFSGVRALPLRLREQTIGALNLFLVDDRGMNDDDQRAAQALADVATIGILQQRALAERELLAGQLQSALTNRLVIEQAKGVLAERGRIEIENAFVALRNYCRHHRAHISDTAAKIVAGELDADTVLLHDQQPLR